VALACLVGEEESLRHEEQFTRVVVSAPDEEKASRLGARCGKEEKKRKRVSNVIQGSSINRHLMGARRKRK